MGKNYLVMKLKVRFNSILTTLAFLIVLPQIIQAENEPSMVKVAANNPNFLYVGRVVKEMNKVVFSYPGVTILANFEGDALDLLFNELGIGGNEHTNYLQITIDKGSPIVLALQSDVAVYQIARNLSKGPHSLEIFKRTESSVGTVEFLGIRLSKGFGLVAPPILPNRKMLFIGNSITCGFGNDTIIPGNLNSGFRSKNENNYNAYGAITARALEAQYVAVAYSGRGITKNYDGSSTGLAPTFFHEAIPDREEYAWKHALYVPDVILINLGTNDFSAERQGFGKIDSAAFVGSYLDFIADIKKQYPNATLICAVGCMMSDWYPAGAKHWTRIQNYVQSVAKQRNKMGDTKIHYLKFDPQNPPYGEDWHPSTATHQKMATTLVHFIKQLNIW
ncbi:MAG TPA: hypothetical protein DCR46_07275 [Cytophagales bacterium]|nr:hypothetical protein [Cytophagales bacterium]